MDAEWFASLGVALAIPAVIVLLIVIAVWRSNDERRASFRSHRRKFAKFLASVQAMNAPDAVLAYERERRSAGKRFSKYLEWPLLNELLPHSTPKQLDTLRARAQELEKAALNLAYAKTDRSAKGWRAAKLELAAALRVMYPEFSDRSIREAAAHALFDSLF